MAGTLLGILGLIVILVGIIMGIWALRHQSRQYPKGTRIPMDEERKAEPRWTGWTQGGGHG
jgi:uncharacterized protein YneF (UPF0154 family)